MTLYAESSAVLAWLLGEKLGAEVLDAMASADLVFTSDLTFVECDRVLLRAVTLGEIPEAEAAGRRAELNGVAGHWATLSPDPDVLARARMRFPSEPVRTLDAIHLSSALVARTAVGDTAVLSLDEVVRKNARALGFDVQPRSL